MRTLARSPVPYALAVGATVGYAWWATGFRRFTWPERAAVGLPAFGLLAVAYAARRPRADLPSWWRGVRSRVLTPEHRRTRRGVLTWLGVIALIGAWELFSYAMAPRSVWPTASSLLVEVDHSHPVRTVVFLVWLAIGLDLLRR